MKILCIKVRQLGDTVLWTSALHALRETFPGAEIDIACSAPYSSLFTPDPRFSKCFGLLPGFWKNLPAVREWRKSKYDYVLTFHANRTTAWLSRLSGAKKRVIHHHSRKALSYGSQLPIPHLGKPMPAFERDTNVVRALGFQGDTPATRLFTYTNWVDDARERLEKSLDFRKPIAVLGLGASRPSKTWPLEKFIQLSELLKKQMDVVAIYDSPILFEGREALVRRLSESVKLIRTPSLQEAAGILSHADCYIGSDSGLKHMAIALGRPSVTLFGPESIGEWHGYAKDKHPTFQIAVACRDQNPEDPAFAWCGAEVCPLASHACMHLISPSAVAEQVLALVSQ